MSEVKVLKPYIGGQYVASKTEKYTDAFNPSTGEVIANAVAYTHLDVYKRQPLPRPWPPPRAWRT